MEKKGQRWEDVPPFVLTYLFSVFRAPLMCEALGFVP